MARPSDEELVRAGREALAVADWEAARSCFERAYEREPSAEALDGLSEVAHFQGRYERAIELKERAFAEYRRRDRRVEAADLARWLAFLHATCRGNYAVASAWMARAERLLDGVEECAAHGWLILDRAPFTREPAERERLAASALAIARRFGDADLEFEAVALLGESYVASGRVAEGMRLLDEAMAAIAAGEVVGHGAVGEIYCRLLGACEHVADVRRAEEWIEALDRYVVWTDFVRPVCRTHYGGILIALGRWAEAEAELTAAIEMLGRGYRGDLAFALVRLADLRVRQGRLEEAERLLEGCEWHPVARRAAATIALIRGDLALAEDLARLCLEGADPPDPSCGPALELLLSIQLARGGVADARATLARLRALAANASSRRLEASADLAAGRISAAEGDAGATAQLARALVPNAPDGAVYEGRLALAAFERLGALRDADVAAALLRGLGAPGRPSLRGRGTLTRREAEVLALLADGLSNADIAGRLVISRRTAEHHVARVLAKLDLASRAEAAAYAVRERAGRDP